MTTPPRGTTDDPLVPELPERLRRRLRVDANGCWIWTGPLYPDGYGMVYVLGSGSGSKRRYTRAHRVVWETLRSPIPAGLELDHLAGVCLSRACCNPDHLEPVTHAENVRRWAATRPKTTRCPRDHDLTRPGSTSSGRCRACRRAAAARRSIAA